MRKRPNFGNVVAGSDNRTDTSIGLNSGSGLIARASHKVKTGYDNRVSAIKGLDSQVKSANKDPNSEMNNNVETISSCNLADVLANLFGALTLISKAFSSLSTFPVSSFLLT